MGCQASQSQQPFHRPPRLDEGGGGVEEPQEYGGGKGPGLKGYPLFEDKGQQTDPLDEEDQAEEEEEEYDEDYASYPLDDAVDPSQDPYQSLHGASFCGPGARMIVQTKTGSRKERVRRMTSSKARPAAPPKGNSERLPHLNGARFAVSIWVLLSHSEFWFNPSHPSNNMFKPFVWRARVGVNFLICLSGFLTHYTQSKKDGAGTAGSLAQFYTRRFGRVIINTWLAMAVAALTMKIFEVPYGPPNWSFLKLVRCFTFLEGWVDPDNAPVEQCPNFPSWTIGALIPSWLLYPIFWRYALGFVEKLGPTFLIVLAMALYIGSFGQTGVAYLQNEGILSRAFYKRTYLYPPSQLADFGLGACAAALVKAAPPPQYFGVAGDVLLLAVLGFALRVPAESDVRSSENVEVLFIHGFSLAIAAYLYCSTATRWCLSSKLLAHPAMVALGDYAFAVYLWQAPIHLFMVIAIRHGWRLNPPIGEGTPAGSVEVPHEVFLAFLSAVWIFSGLYVELFESLLQKKLRAATEQWAEKPLRWFCQRSTDKDHPVEQGAGYQPFANP